jgi:3-isopropylmalate/(R)-2-methylmalate dehydratase large subunit
MPETLFDKIWNAHTVRQEADGSALMYVDRLFLHERTGSIAMTSLRDDGRAVRNPRQVFATMDHIVDTTPGRTDKTRVPGGEEFIQTMRRVATDAGISLFDINDPRHGITHLIAAEQGIALPGLVVACPDSHTCTLGALGVVGWGIGSSDCEHALATETLRATKPRQMRVVFDGHPGRGVTAKDLVLHLIGAYSASGGAGHAIEFSGSAIDAMSLEERFTLCNMAVEFSAFTGIIAPDDKVIEFVRDRPNAPVGDQWNAATNYWRTLRSDPDAVFDREIVIDSAQVAPTVTWGISPQHAVSVTGTVPSLDAAVDADEREQMQLAMDYMDVASGQPIIGLPINAAFIGSCTNARISDLRSAADILQGGTVAAGVRAICTPGSAQVKRQAEREGIDRIFTDAGFEWREPGCSLCFHAGGEGFSPGDRVVTSTNRNFRGRQGPGVRSHLASPATVAAAAIAGKIVDVRESA